MPKTRKKTRKNSKRAAPQVNDSSEWTTDAAGAWSTTKDAAPTKVLLTYDTGLGLGEVQDRATWRASRIPEDGTVSYHAPSNKNLAQECIVYFNSRRSRVSLSAQITKGVALRNYHLHKNDLLGLKFVNDQ